MAKNLYFCQLRDFLVSKSKSLIYPASSLIFNINKYEDFKSAQYQSLPPSLLFVISLQTKLFQIQC